MVCLVVSRGAVLDTPVCLNAGGRYLVDVIFNKPPGSDGASGSHILIDSVRSLSTHHKEHFYRLLQLSNANEPGVEHSINNKSMAASSLRQHINDTLPSNLHTCI